VNSTDLLREALQTDWIARIGLEYGKLAAVLAGHLRALDDWLPTPENVNALPEGIRRYVHNLQTRCDPAGDVQTMALQADTIRGLAAKVRELEAELASVQKRNGTRVNRRSRRI
jgi:hypothetical protein